MIEKNPRSPVWAKFIPPMTVLLLIVAPTLARRPIKKAFLQAYPSANNSALDNLPSRSDHCGVCHYDFSGGGPRNPYGAAVEATPNRDKSDILSIGGLDSDGDGFSNEAEITDTIAYSNTPTFPGLKLSNVGQTTSIDRTDINGRLTPVAGDDTTAPEIVVTAPNGSETLTANTQATIQWTASDESGIAAIDIYVSTDNGSNYSPVALGLANSGSIPWTPANRPTTQALVMIVATDNAGNDALDISDAPFTIESPQGGVAPTTLRDFDQPGTQPLESVPLNDPDACGACHGFYDNAVEPYHNWQGSMMANASVDPLMLALLAIANKDAPDSGDLCLRCHLPAGWLQGRSVPTDGSAMLTSDKRGVSCDFCHRLVDPEYVAGVSPPQDEQILAGLDQTPQTPANGMYVVDPDPTRRGPFTDATSGHTVIVSPFHRKAALCGTCHDVSNPAFEKDPHGVYLPNEFDTPAADFHSNVIAPVERTYSEWLNSDYNTAQGVYAPQFGGNKDYVSTCQDCHMHDVSGRGCNMGSAPLRDDLPLHDMTGGSVWMTSLLPILAPATVDQTTAADAVARARYMLDNAAELTATQQADKLKVTVTNNTGHKLPTGYPEGRRIWLNVRFYSDSNDLLAESGAYDPNSAVLTEDSQIKVYEAKPGLDGISAQLLDEPNGPSFHFTLNNRIYKDNRIPPRGFTNAAFAEFGGAPADYSYQDGRYWDDTLYHIPGGAVRAEVTLYYQSTSKEFLEFLRDNNTVNSAGTDAYNLWQNNGKCPPEPMAHYGLPLAPTGPAGDLNGSDTVDFADLSLLSLYWGLDCTQNDCRNANLDDSDTVVNAADLAVIAGNWLEGL